MIYTKGKCLMRHLKRRNFLRSALYIVMLTGLLGVTSCITKHVVIPDDPLLTKIKEDYSNTELNISQFSVRNLSSKDSVYDIKMLQNSFVQHILAKNRFQSVYDRSTMPQGPRAQKSITAEVQLTPNQTKKRTYILRYLDPEEV